MAGVVEHVVQSRRTLLEPTTFDFAPIAIESHDHKFYLVGLHQRPLPFCRCPFSV